MPEFIRRAEHNEWGRSLRLFRGQARRGNLVPGIARPDPQIDKTKQEREALRQFRLLGDRLLSGADTKTLGLLVLAQHYGLKTRLLDWTSNPLVALYLACASREPGDVFVYMLDADGFEKEDIYDCDPFAEDQMWVVQPYLNNPRVHAQHGWFTLHPYDSSRGTYESIGDSSDMDACTVELRIPKKFRARLQESLRVLGIDSHTVMPDLGGLSQYLNERLERSLPIAA